MLSGLAQEGAYFMSETPGINQRDIHFSFEGCDLRRWCGGDPCRSHSFNANSLMFPEGEKFFIESVRYFRDRITDPKLQEEVKGFIGQEAVHGREHRVYNAELGKLGYDVERLERRTIRAAQLHAQNTAAKGHLAVTIALEHFTAIMADGLLSDPRELEGADPRMAALWRWHAIEETEHKAVAFDVYKTVSPGVVGYIRRCLIMLNTAVLFWTYMLLNYFHLTRRDGVGFFTAAWRFFCLGFVNPGDAAPHPAALACLASCPSFHPWKHANPRPRGAVEGGLCGDGESAGVVGGISS